MRQKKYRNKRKGLPQGQLWMLVLFLSIFTGFTYQSFAQELTLEKALEIAFKNSPAIQSAAYSLDISQHNLSAQQAGLKSQFSLTLTPFQYSNAKVFNELTSKYNIQELTKSEARLT